MNCIEAAGPVPPSYADAWRCRKAGRNKVVGKQDRKEECTYLVCTILVKPKAFFVFKSRENE